MARGVTVGPSLIIEGMRILWRRDIRWLVLIPLLVNIILFISVAGFAASWLQNWITTISTSVPEWLQWLAWVIWFLFALLALAIYAFTFTILANLIGSPFYGVIAQRVIAAEIASACVCNSWIPQRSASVVHFCWCAKKSATTDSIPWCLG